MMVDNTTTVFVINNMGTSHNAMLNTLTTTIWEFCIMNKIKLTAARLPGSKNIIADKESRNIYREGEWMLNTSYLHLALDKFDFQPTIDLFYMEQP